MDNKLYIKIPTWEKGKWDYTTFQTKENFKDFVEGLFIGNTPGTYGFDQTSELFNEHARNFNTKGLFCESPEGSTDFLNYWDTEKEKCRKGVIFKNGKKIWYLPRFYYHWVNFLRIYNKVQKKFMFPDVRDLQYHMALYETCAELNDLNNAILKKRQAAISYFHICKLYNRYIFEEGYVGKLMASDKKYIDATNGCWKFLEEYHNFTNEHTAWVRHNFPDKVFSWQQKVETKTYDGRKVDVGTKATITGVSMDKDAASGVGGACDECYYEEGGIAPTADVTYGFMRQAMREGAITTGIFTIAGSVGDLGQCLPLKKFMFYPVENDFYPVHTNLLDGEGTEGVSALFLPEQWGMPPFIDQYGNSMVKEALVYLEEDFARKKKLMTPEDYQLEVSQRPRNIKEAFDMRTVSKFPVRHTSRQERRIIENEYPIEYVELERTDKGTITTKKSDRKPIDKFPFPKTAEDKKGVICIHERPIRGLDTRIEWGMYYASIDPVNTGKTTTSESLASVYVYKNLVQVTRTNAEGETETFMEGDKIAAWWCGRYDDVNETNEQMSLLVEYYNAWTLSEVGTFNQYMIGKKRTRYLVPRKEMLFDKELEVQQQVYNDFGWTNSTKLWERMLENGVDYLSEELKTYYKEDGTVERIKFGVERIPDIMLLKEMQVYEPKGNYDRIISYCALITFVKIQRDANGIRNKIERKDEDLANTENLGTLIKRQPFSHIGRNRASVGTGIKRSAFRHLK